eukprot:12901678-Alexandrium_andersonii.AAC.1
MPHASARAAAGQGPSAGRVGWCRRPRLLRGQWPPRRRKVARPQASAPLTRLQIPQLRTRRQRGCSYRP